jgi:protein-S-isoprenylcysteine O-methyltransferase Ste14
MNLRSVSLAATAVLSVAVVSLLFRRSLFAHGPIGIGFQVLAAAVMLWARMTFGGRSFHAGANPTAGGLVTNGPYRFVRHPIYAAILLFVWVGIASQGSLLSVLTGIVATAATAVRIGAEERLVESSYPEYADYARRTKRLIPFVL